MSTGQPQNLTIQTLRGAYNDSDPAQMLADDECVQADNVEFFFSMCGERRLGTATLAITSSDLEDEAGIVHLSQWFPTNVVTAPEFLAIGATVGVSTTVAHRNTSGVWSEITPGDALANTAPDVFGIVAQPLDAND